MFSLFGLIYYVPLLACCFLVVTSTLPKDQFSTKTAYEWVHDTSSSGIKDQLVSLDVPGYSCSAVHVAVVARHGSRYPSDGNMVDLGSLFNKIKTIMNYDSNPDFRNWTDPFKLEDDSKLAPLGEEEHQGLGKRLAERLSSLLSDKQNLSDFKFLSSRKQRSKRSAFFFHKGFASALGIPGTAFRLTTNDLLLRFYESCDRYNHEVDDNDEAMKEYNDYMKGEKIRQVRDKIAAKLGVDKNILNTDDVELIYNTCPVETIIFKSSPWCSVLEQQDLDILEYLGDLEEYYEYGYGHDLNWKQSCPLLSEFVSGMNETITKTENSNDDQGIVAGHFAFGHSGTVGPVLAALGLFKDSIQLKANNFDAQANRTFSTSINTCFTANVMFVLYKCTPKLGNGPADFYIKVLVNEEPVMLPACNDYQCSYQDFVEHYSDLVSNCRYRELCKLSGGSSLYVSRLYHTLVLIIIVMFNTLLMEW